eukprot:1457856-Pyramimonas_sp.AAC.1
MEYKQTVAEADLAAVVEDVRRAEANGDIPPWVEEYVPETLIEPAKVPEPVEPMSTRTWEAVGATEIVFPNGIRVAYKQTDFLDDQVETLKTLQP